MKIYFVILEVVVLEYKMFKNSPIKVNDGINYNESKKDNSNEDIHALGKNIKKEIQENRVSCAILMLFSI